MLNPFKLKISVFGLVFFFILTSIVFAQNSSNSAEYNQLIQLADKANAAKDYGTALLNYEKANRLNPSQKYASDHIENINNILRDNTALQSSLFEDAILKAEDFFARQAYPQAKIEYQKAISIDPSAQFPKDRLAKISSLYTDPSDQTYFSNSVTDGDNAIASGNYTRAIQFYETAVSVKPDAISVREKLTNARKMLAEAQIRKVQAEKIIEGADKLLQADKNTEALTEYKKALELSPNNAIAKQKIQEIETLFAQKKALQESYDKTVDQADQYYLNRDFVHARLKYQEALKAKPEARYPKDMLEKTKTGESQLMSEQERYDAILASADGFYKSGDMEASLSGYNSAAELRPAENYPKTKIKEIEDLLSAKLTKKQAFDLAIKNGDQELAEKKLDQALISYQKALSVLPDEAYPATQIKEINQLKESQKQLDAAYSKLIAEADKFFNQQKYEESIASYSKAIELKPSEIYPAGKVTEARNLLLASKNKEENYASFVSSGDKAFAENKLTEALSAYNQALTIKPLEKYPKQKSDEIDQIQSKQKDAADQYSRAISEADNLLAGGKLNDARVIYQKANVMKPEEKYPLSKIAEIDAKLNEIQKLANDYKAAIDEGDKFIGTKEYDKATVAYEKAGTYKPGENYPKEQLRKINATLDALKSAEDSYSQAILQGDLRITEKNYAAAAASYRKALSVKPAETYPKAQLTKIDSALVAIQKSNDSYLNIITSADKLFEEKKFGEAADAYKDALSVKPGENYPTSKITECQSAIDQIKANQIAYDKAIAEGEQQLKTESYENALASFLNASKYEPEEDFPKQKAKEIQTILDHNKAIDQQYSEAIRQGDSFFASAKYNEALEPYQKATTIKPSEKYPADQILKVNTILADQKKMEESYQQTIADGEKLLTEKKYREARASFSSASELKPNETLPKTKIAEIETIIAEIKRKDDAYAKAVSSASELYSSHKLKEALRLFEDAMVLKPDEKLPQENIVAIKAELKTMDDTYQNAIVQADSKLAADDLPEALNAYQKATEIKPDENYPKSKIKEINTILSNRKAENDKLYASYISDGDKSAENKDYIASISAYTKASGLKPEESYPKLRIEAVSALQKELEAARRTEFNKAIGIADNLYNTKIFDQAIDAYVNAGLILLSDPYPQLQISKIRQYMINHAIQNLTQQASTIIADGNEKKFSFTVIEPRQRKNNYILIKARSTGKTAPKVYLNYGRDGQKNGGVVLRSLEKNEFNDYVIRISGQDKWYREDNNWISLFVETGSVEITKIELAAGD